MDKFDQIQRLHRIFKKGGRHTQLSLAEDLDVSPETVKKLIAKLRNELGAPLDYDRSQHGYWYIPRDAKAFELPGVWLTAEEVRAFALILELIDSLDHTILAKDFEYIKKRILTTLENRGVKQGSFVEKIAFLPMRKTQCDSHVYNKVCQGVLQEKRLAIQYQDYSGRKTERTVSPLKIVFYQNNWYLDAYCHLRDSLRSFMLSRINTVQTTKQKNKAVPKQEQLEHFQTSYGIFAGKAQHTAVIRFFPEVAREVANQQWHPKQIGEWQGKEYLLSIPYSDDRELVRDILNYGNQAVVERPAKLKNKIRNILRGMWELYS